MRKEKKVLIIIAFFVCGLFLISFISANWFTDLFNVGNNNEDLKGELASMKTLKVNVSVNPSNNPPKVITVDNLTFFCIDCNGAQNVYIKVPTLISPKLAPSMTNFSFNFVAYDDSGLLPGINPNEDVSSYVEANISFGTKKRTDTGCRFVNNVGTTYTKNYSCNVSIYWSDDPQPNSWTIRVKILTLPSKSLWSDVNGTQIMKFGRAFDTDYDPTSVNWTNNKITSNGVDVGSDNFINITQKGNLQLKESTSYSLQLNATMLIGYDPVKGNYSVNNFTANQINTINPQDSCSSGGNLFSESTFVDIKTMTLNPDANPPSRDSAKLGFCAKTATNIYPQTYSTPPDKQWQLNDYCNGCTN